MPPKKRGAAAAAAAAIKAANKADETEPTVAKKVKEEETTEAVTKENIASKLRELDKNKKRMHLPDKGLPNAQLYSVLEDYDCMLNQTNIGHNNNKFYVIQVLQMGGIYYCWNRWGRVGETGMNNGPECFGNSKENAIKSFEKKFLDKTKNHWKDRASFVPHAGKYTLIEMDAGGEEESAAAVPAAPTTAVAKPLAGKVEPSKLDLATQELVSLLFDKDMFKGALKQFEIDVKKMPLGKLSKSQIAKGFEVLEEIEQALKAKKVNSTLINDLSSKFYTVIPQDFGRQRPPAIGDDETLQKKYDMLMVLSDIELAQSMEESGAKESASAAKQPNPLDVNYDLLNCELSLLDKSSNEFKIIQNYTNQTKSGWRNVEILDVWRVERKEEKTRFKAHDSIDNRKLLWHGTNVAVVVAILKSGLRIMPHSGGRVGRGIYFASENGKSAGYVGCTIHKGKRIGIMFLNEVALGKEHHIFMDNGSLTAAPSGHDCVIAKGMTEPDTKLDTTLMLDGKKVIVPQGKPIPTNLTSSFSQSEYLIYKESQNRIRYLLKMKF